MKLTYALAAVAVQILTPASAEAPRAMPVTVSVDDSARFLAGLPPLSDPWLIELSNERSWQRHAELLNSSWSQVEASRLSKVRQWSRTHIPGAAASDGTMFYMFSGPDFLYADAIYPQASTYVFCGIEPVGPIPDLTSLRRHRLAGELQALRNSLDSVLSFSFFITKEMKKELRNHAFSGTLPVLSIFLARAGKTIHEVEYVGLDKDGGVHVIAAPERSDEITAPGVRIRFSGGGSDKRRTLYFFSTDISDGGVKKTGFLAFCNKLAPGNSLVKSASYLMHNSYFSAIRSFLLENSTTLVQDDSGIPVSFFAPEQWQLRVFGSYPGPIPLFKERYQSRLAEMYRDRDVVPLDFGIGYRHRLGQSTLMVASRRPANWAERAPKAVPVAVPVADASVGSPKEDRPMAQ